LGNESSLKKSLRAFGIAGEKVRFAKVKHLGATVGH
jgi:hypothetical protein